jgi:hypothetical protein
LTQQQQQQQQQQPYILASTDFNAIMQAARVQWLQTLLNRQQQLALPVIVAIPPSSSNPTTSVPAAWPNVAVASISCTSSPLGH